jgi:hypothetical protein
MTRAQDIEEAQTALAGAGAKPGEIVIADLCAKAIAASMSCARIINADPGSTLQSRPQHVTAFAQDVILAIDQQTHHLTLGDAEAE